MAWAEPSDVTGRWIGDEPIPATDDQLAVLIADTEDSIDSEFPDLQERIDAGSIPAERVTKIVARVVIRFLRNPEGRRSRQETAGPYQENVTYGGDEPGTQYLTDAERRELAGERTGSAYMVDTLPAYAANGYFPAPPSWQTT